MKTALRSTIFALFTVSCLLTPDSSYSQAWSQSARYLLGGVAGAIPYQTAPNITGFTAAGTAGQLLQSNGTSAPTWVSAGLPSGTNYQALILNDSGTKTWSNIFYDGSGNSSIDIFQRKFYASNGSSIMANFTGGTGIATLSSKNGYNGIYMDDGTIVSGTSRHVAIDFGGFHLANSSLSSGRYTVDWGLGLLEIGGTETTSYDWYHGYINDTTGVLAINTKTRSLYLNDGVTKIAGFSTNEAWFNSLVQHVVTAVSTSGTYNLVVNTVNLLNASSNATGVTLVLPSTPNNNDFVYLKSAGSGNITVSTWSGGTINHNPSLGSNSFNILIYDSATSTWY